MPNIKLVGCPICSDNVCFQDLDYMLKDAVVMCEDCFIKIDPKTQIDEGS